MKELEPLRTRIDELDRTLVELVGQRQTICREVAEIKKRHGIPMMQSARVEQVLDRVSALGLSHDVSPDLLRQLYRLIIAEACRLEDEIIDA